MENLKSKNLPKHDVYSTLTPVNDILSLFSLSRIYKDGGKLKYSNSVTKTLLLLTFFLIINICIIYYKIKTSNGPKKFGFNDFFEMAYLLGYMHFLGDVIFVYKYGRDSFVTYLSVYDCIDKILDMPYYVEIKRSIRRMYIFFSIVGIICVTTDFVAWTLNFGFIITMTYSIEYVYQGLRLLGALDMISNCTQIYYRLKTIGDLLETYYDETDYLPEVVKDVLYDKVWFKTDNKKFNLNHLKTIDSKHILVLRLTRCYLLLKEQNEYINVMHGFRYLLKSTLYLLDMVILMNLLIRLIVGTLLSTTYTGLLIVSTIIKALTSTLVLVYGMHRCEQDYRETERIVRLIDRLVINKKARIEMREPLKELKDLIMSRLIYHHAGNFYRLDYSSLVSLASVIVTYSIILLQNVQ